jgi:acylphosphatase
MSLGIKKHLDVRVYGKVQGVTYRLSANKEAKKLGLVGYAKNLPDGTVQIEAEGNENKLKLFLNWCKNGSELSQVSDIEYDINDNIKEFDKFETRW